MDWAQGIEVEHGRLVARVADAEGKQERIALGELSARGLPTTRSTLRPIERVDLSELHAIESGEYLEIFGLQKAGGSEDKHVVYQLLTERRRWVIPSLALIRGLFRPTKYLLDDAFRPQMLERTSYYDAAGGDLKITALWGEKVGNKVSDPSALLTWLWLDPLARQLAGSLHECAMKGEIALEPVATRVDVAVNGIKVGNTFYATRCTVTSAYIPPAVPNCEGREIHFYGPALERSEAESSLVKMAATTPLNEDGELRVSDGEWAVLQPILRPDTRGTPPSLDLRQVWNLLLQEVASGTRVRSSDVNPALEMNLNYYWDKWRQKRRLHRAIEVLHQLRKQG